MFHRSIVYFNLAERDGEHGHSQPGMNRNNRQQLMSNRRSPEHRSCFRDIDFFSALSFCLLLLFIGEWNLPRATAAGL